MLQHVTLTLWTLTALERASPQRKIMNQEDIDGRWNKVEDSKDSEEGEDPR